MEHMKKLTLQAVEHAQDSGVKDWTALKSAIRGNLSEYLYRMTKRNPMILPVFMEV
ncbi:hypothetical protein FACS1894202_13470 [Clostridia bacterium]|nr:hypothetical protein FACS1894202_13470 [Clostridia bacterium]